ncbi:hypothetical protein ACTU3I_00695 [Microbacterium sp. RD1]|uniref:hypothetical protein n=1 Tax=Microbacterium sp. RD1 TaxID=3457313 RepID=UPI003FA53231
MSQDDDDLGMLRARLAQLEAENRALAAGIRPTRAATGRWRAPVSAALLVLAALLVPVSVVAGWARAELVDPERFVATLAPLVDAPEVQALIIDEASAALQEVVDVGAMTDAVIDGVAALDLPPTATSALEMLRAPAEAGVRSLLDDTVATVIESDVFSDAWGAALRVSHRALVTAATGASPGGGVTVDESGVVALELEPILAEVRERLVDRGWAFAEAIPAVDRTIVVLQSDALVTARVVYGLAVAAGTWLPVLAVVLLIAGVLVARRRSTGILGAGIALAVGAGVLVTAMTAGGVALTLASGDLGIPADALAVIYEQVGASMRQTALVLLVLGVAVAVLAWSQGRSRAAVATRTAVGRLNGGVRVALAARDVAPSLAAWLDRWRVVVRAALALAALGWLILLRPLGVGDVLLVCVVVLLLWWVSELLRRPAGAAASEIPGARAAG